MASTITSKSQSSESNNTSAVSIDSLPTDVVREVVEMVASDSIFDLHGVKLCSKSFCKLTEEKDTIQRVSFNRYRCIQWFPTEKQYEFVKFCEASGNNEILYREGLRRYFNNRDGDVDGGGLQRLKTAAANHHKCAKYVYGMIKLCSENHDSRKEGIEQLRSLRMTRCLISSRQKVETHAIYLWRVHNLSRNQTSVCKSKTTCRGFSLPTCVWYLACEEDDDRSLCEDCRWDYELNIFNRIFNVE